MRAALVLACLVAAVNASAQGTSAPAKPDTKPDTKQGAKAPATQGTKTDAKQATKAAPPAVATKQAARPAAPQAPPAPVTPVIMRETFAYDAETRRDPFVSLLTSAELRPTVVDLRLTGILYDETGRNSIATMRDMQTDVMYRVRTGQVIGRMRVALIKRGVVIFSIEEFGLNRQDSLVLGDTTKKVAK
jgi:hypothetical protein